MGVTSKFKFALVSFALLVQSPGLRAEYSAETVADCNSGQPERQLSGCSKLIEVRGLSRVELVVAYSRRSDAYFQLLMLDQTIADRQKALELEPSESSHKARLSVAYHVRGLLRSRDKDYSRAIEDFSEATRHDPTNHAAFEARGLAHLEAGDLDKAINDLWAAVRIQPSNAPYAYQLARLFQHRASMRMLNSAYTHAIADYTAAIRAMPAGQRDADVALYVMRAEAHRANNDPKSALEDLDKAIALAPGKIDILRRRGQLFLSAGSALFGNAAERAAADFSEALKLEPKSADLLLLRALTFEQADRFADAVRDYRAVLKLRPNHVDAKESIARITRLQAIQKHAIATDSTDPRVTRLKAKTKTARCFVFNGERFCE